MGVLNSSSMGIPIPTVSPLLRERTVVRSRLALVMVWEGEPGRGLEVGLAKAAGARLHPVSATATTPRATAQAPCLTAERVTPVTVRRPGPTWRLPSSSAPHSLARPASLG